MELLFFVHEQKVVSGSKLELLVRAVPFPAEMMFVSMGHEPEMIVPSILSPSKQQNRESLISKTSHGGEEIGIFVLLLSSQIIPSIAEGNTHASFQEAGQIVLCKNEGSLSAENPERINAIRIKFNRLGWHFIFTQIFDTAVVNIIKWTLWRNTK